MVRAPKRQPAKPRIARPRATRPAARTVGVTPTAAPDDTTREKILATALQVFAECGFDGARTRDIAEQAGANLGLITYYFQNKETLWREAVERAFAELQRELEDVMAAHAGTDERRLLEQLARGFVRFVARRPEFMRLMNDEGKRDTPRMRWLVDRFVQPMHARLRVLIEAAQARGLLPPIAPASLHYIMLGAAGLLFSQAPECRRITGIDPTDPTFAEAHAEAVIGLLMR